MTDVSVVTATSNASNAVSGVEASQKASRTTEETNKKSSQSFKTDFRCKRCAAQNRNCQDSMPPGYSLPRTQEGLSQFPACELCEVDGPDGRSFKCDLSSVQEGSLWSRCLAVLYDYKAARTAKGKKESDEPQDQVDRLSEVETERDVLREVLVLVQKERDRFKTKLNGVTKDMVDITARIKTITEKAERAKKLEADKKQLEADNARLRAELANAQGDLKQKQAYINSLEKAKAYFEAECDAQHIRADEASRRLAALTSGSA